MENKCSSDLKEALVKNKLYFKLAPLHLHYRNATGWSIRTFNNHFISGFSTTYPYFTVSEWYRLIPQDTTTINLLRNARVNLQLSAYACVFGPYYFNKNPMVPPGKIVSAHDKPTHCTYGGHCGTPGYYVGQALDNYRMIKFYMKVTAVIRVTNTLQYIPKRFMFPTTTTGDYLLQAVGDILTLLKYIPTILLFL